MLKTSRKIFFSVVLISLLGSSSRCDAMFATLVVIAMKIAPYLIWTAPPVIIGGYQMYHNSLSAKMDRGFQEARQDRAQLRTEIKGGFDTACQERTRLQTSVDGNGRAISELTKQENLHHQTAVQERGRLHAVSQRSIQANGDVIGLVQTSVHDLSTTEAQHHTEHLQRFNQSDALIQANGNTIADNGVLIQANGDVIRLVQTSINDLSTTEAQHHTENQLKLQTLEEQLACALQKGANMTVMLTDNSGQLSGLTETQKQLKLLLQQHSTSLSEEAQRTKAQLSGLTKMKKEFKLLLQQQSQTHTQQLARIERMLRLSNQPSQLEHHSFQQPPAMPYSLLQRRPLPSSTSHTFLQRRPLLWSSLHALKQHPEYSDE